MKLANVVPALDCGGGVPAVARFVKDAALRSGKFEVKMISLCTSSHGDTSVALTRPRSWLQGVGSRLGEWDGLPYIHVGAFFSELEFQRNRPRRALSRELADCDLIQVVCGSPACANAVIGLGKPVALQVATRIRVERRMRDSVLRGPAGMWRRFMTEITDRMDDRALRMADTIQVENTWMFDYASAVNSNRSYDLIYAPPGVDASVFTPDVSRNPSKDRYILCVARFDDARKNVMLLLEAYARLPMELRNSVELKLAGISRPPKHFWEQARVLKVAERITYIASPSEVELVSIYQKACLFALPSDEEGLGIVVLESMACGVPVVSTRSGGPDGIISDGEDGFLTPLNDATSMADRMEMLLSDTACNQDMGARARQKILDRYENEVAGDAFIESWERLISHKDYG